MSTSSLLFANDHERLTQLQQQLEADLKKNNEIVTRIWEINDKLRPNSLTSSQEKNKLLKEKNNLIQKLIDTDLENKIKSLRAQVEIIGKKLDKNFDIHEPFSIYRNYKP